LKVSDDLGPLPKVHPRALALEKARRELADYLCGWLAAHKLTSAEYLMVLTELAASNCQCLVAVERRAEDD
jgi:hypothetical protein